MPKMPFGPGILSYGFASSAIDSEIFRTLNSLAWRQRLLSSFVFSFNTAFANNRIFLHRLNDRLEHSIFRRFYVSKYKNIDEIQSIVKLIFVLFVSQLWNGGRKKGIFQLIQSVVWFCWMDKKFPNNNNFGTKNSIIFHTIWTIAIFIITKFKF